MSESVKIEVIAMVTDRKSWTVYEWIKSFRKSRLGSLFTGHASNQNASKLTREQKKEVAEILKQPPNEYGLPKEFWDVPQLKEYTQAVFGIEYESRQSYYFLLEFGKLSFKYPDSRSPRRDEQEITRQIYKLRKEIEELPDDYIVYTADETRLQYETEKRKAWLPKGERTFVKTERSKECQNYLGFLDQKSGELKLYRIERGNQWCTIKVLEKLLEDHPQKRVCVVWDNARWHKGRILREELKKGKKLQKLHLLNFPPYAPETNPIEHVWQWGKSQISNRDTGDFGKLRSDFERCIKFRKFEYKI
jgi:transposase